MAKNKYEKCRECKFGYWVEHVPFCTLKKRPCDYVNGKFCDDIFEEKKKGDKRQWEE